MPSSHHDHFIDSVAYMVAGMEVELINNYCLMYVKRRAWWLPEPIYKWFLRQFIVLVYFKK